MREKFQFFSPEKYLFYEGEQIKGRITAFIPNGFKGLPSEKLYLGEEAGLKKIFLNTKVKITGTDKTFEIWNKRLPFFEGRNEIEIIAPYKKDYGTDSYLLEAELCLGDEKLIGDTLKIGLMGPAPPPLTRFNYTDYPAPIYRIGMVNRIRAGSREFSEEDFYAIKRMGFDVVELDLYWDDLEPVEGKFKWDRMGRFIDYADKYDLRVAIKVVMWDLPQWITERVVSDRGDRGMCPPN
ncbi:MAG: beta-galactosidase [Candidatus Omnitrophica bacterium]|nr:beta-galactosidase [Candidatus Omnitrophota bacterium]